MAHHTINYRVPEPTKGAIPLCGADIICAGISKIYL